MRTEGRREKHTAGRPPRRNKSLWVVTLTVASWVVAGYRGRTGGNSFSPGKSTVVIHPEGRSAGALFNSLKKIKAKPKKQIQATARGAGGGAPQDFLAEEHRAGVGVSLTAQRAAQSPGQARRNSEASLSTGCSL